MLKLVLLRHGESDWNKENRFTGWTDVDLSEKGRQEAHEAGVTLKEGSYAFDVAYTSVLKRAIRTLWMTLDELDLMWIPVHRSWRLNERHYGALQGLNKSETAAKFGEDQVKIWRRSYDVPPPVAHTGRPALSGSRSTLQRPDPGGTAAHRMSERYRGSVPALLAFDDRAGCARRQTGADRGARQ